MGVEVVARLIAGNNPLAGAATHVDDLVDEVANVAQESLHVFDPDLCAHLVRCSLFG